MSASNNPSILKLCSESTLRTYRFDYQVTIDEISTRQKDFSSDYFSPPGMLIPKFYLQCDTDRNQVTVFNLFVAEKRSNVYVAFKIKGLDESEKELFKKESKSQKIIKNIELYSVSQNHLFLTGLPEDKLTIVCEFTFQIDTFDNQIVPRNEEFKKIRNSNYMNPEKFESLYPNQKIALDFDNLLQSGKFSDVELAVGERKFKAHKNILAARSPVFAVMFEHDFEENRTNRVEITDVDQDILQQILRYIYTSIIPQMENNAVEVLAAADKYQLESLKAECANKIKSQFTMDSVFDALVIADTYNVPTLKKQAVNFISSRRDMQTALQKLFTSHQTDQLIDAMRGITKTNK